jgi:hypothetical protein
MSVATLKPISAQVRCLPCELSLPVSTVLSHSWFWAKHRVPKLKVMNDMTFPVSVLWDGRTGGGKARHVMTLEQVRCTLSGFDALAMGSRLGPYNLVDGISTT